jgi:hypothetical protein
MATDNGPGGPSAHNCWGFNKSSPTSRNVTSQDFYRNRFIDELEQTGFIRELAARYPGALR